MKLRLNYIKLQLVGLLKTLYHSKISMSYCLFVSEKFEAVSELKRGEQVHFELFCDTLYIRESTLLCLRDLYEIGMKFRKFFCK